jgi:hypothetical protein
MRRDPLSKAGVRARRRGVVFPILALVIIVMVGFLALAIDLGMAAIAKTQVQQAADLAALTAMRSLNGDSSINYNQTAATTNRRNCSSASAHTITIRRRGHSRRISRRPLDHRKQRSRRRSHQTWRPAHSARWWACSYCRRFRQRRRRCTAPATLLWSWTSPARCAWAPVSASTSGPRRAPRIIPTRSFRASGSIPRATPAYKGPARIKLHRMTVTRYRPAIPRLRTRRIH